MIVRNEAPTTNNDYVPQRNLIDRNKSLIEPKNLIGQKISKNENLRLSIGEKNFGGIKLSNLPSDEEKLSKERRTKFEVSLDGNFRRDCEFVVTLPVFDGKDSSPSERESFRPRRESSSPKRGEKESASASKKKDNKSSARNDGAFGGFFNDISSDNETSSGSEEEGKPPSYLRKLAWAWEIRAFRAEESLAKYQASLRERTGETKLKETLSSLLNSDSGVMDEQNVGKESKSTWNARAFDTMPGDEWIVVKVPQANRSHVMCDFCDGDVLDEKQWLEGPFNQDLTIRELIDYQRGTTRSKRRARTDNLLRKVHPRKPKEKKAEGPITTSAGSSSSSNPVGFMEEAKN